MVRPDFVGTVDSHEREIERHFGYHDQVSCIRDTLCGDCVCFWIDKTAWIVYQTSVCGGVGSKYQQAILPLYAVIVQGDTRYVYVEKDGKAEKRRVDLGVLINWQVHVKSGLKPGERVVVVGHRFLDDGQAVNVIKNVRRPDEIFTS